VTDDKIKAMICAAIDELDMEEQALGKSRQSSLVRTKLEEALLWRGYDVERTINPDARFAGDVPPEVLNG